MASISLLSALAPISENPESPLDEWRYIGGDSGLRRMVYRQRYPGRPAPPKKYICMCGNSIKENCYIENLKDSKDPNDPNDSNDSKKIQIVGNCCVAIFMKADRSMRINKKTCERCRNSHSNQSDNWCNDCRGGVLKSGKYKGKSYRWVWKNDIDYCRRLQNVDVHESLVDFTLWLISQGRRKRSRDDSSTSRVKSDAGSKTICCGKYLGYTYSWIWENQKSYCRWVKSLKHADGPLLDFQNWLFQSS